MEDSYFDLVDKAMHYIPVGMKNAISLKELSGKLGCDEETTKKVIESANNCLGDFTGFTHQLILVYPFANEDDPCRCIFFSNDRNELLLVYEFHQLRQGAFEIRIKENQQKWRKAEKEKKRIWRLIEAI